MLGTQGRGPRKAGGFLLAVVASALLVAWWSGVASAAQITSTVEVCKDAANGTAGSTFDFQLYKGTGSNNAIGTTVQVAGGHCGTLATGVQVANNNGPITYHITEALDPASQDPQNPTVWQIQSANPGPGSGVTITDTNASKGTVTFTLDQAGGESVVNVVNGLAPSSLKICKTTSSSAIDGKSFSFTIAGTQTVSAVANGNCSFPIAIQQGTRVVVQEQFQPPVFVQSATGDSNSGPTVLTTGTDLSVGKVKVQIVAGKVNVLTFDNEIQKQPSQGNLEICKVAADPFINQIASFHYTIVAGGQTFQTDVKPGQCSGAINGTASDACPATCGIPAGPAVVTETIPDNANWKLLSVTLHQNSSGQVGLVNTGNGTANISVPVYSAGDMAIDFTNQSNVASVKVCKFLTAGSGALAGTTFHFTVTDSQIVDNNGNPRNFPVDVVASPPGSAGACVFVQSCDRYTHTCTNLQVPVGSTVQATESNSNPFIDAGGGPGNDFTTNAQSVTPGVNEIDVTNMALGQLEFCKYMTGEDSGLGQSFTFTYSGPKSGKVTTTANNCTFPAVVPAGNYTVTEDLSGLFVKMNDGTKVPAFLFAASDARGPFGDSRCVPPASYPAPDPNNNPPLPPPGNGCGLKITVNVPFFDSTDPSTGETTVSYWNSQTRAQVKICKLVDSHSTGSIGGLTWTYSISDTTGDLSNYQTGKVAMNACTGRIGNIPVAYQGPDAGSGCTASLCPNVVRVTENGSSAANTVWQVQSITVSGGYDPSIDLNNGVINYHTGPGTNVVTYTNRAVPLTAPAG